MASGKKCTTSSTSIDAQKRVGVSDDAEDKDRWRQFMDLTFKYHAKLCKQHDLDCGGSWRSVNREIKRQARQDVLEKLSENTLFPGIEEKHLIEVIDWRLGHIFKDKKYNSRKDRSKRTKGDRSSDKVDPPDPELQLPPIDSGRADIRAEPNDAVKETAADPGRNTS